MGVLVRVQWKKVVELQRMVWATFSKDKKEVRELNVLTHTESQAVRTAIEKVLSQKNARHVEEVTRTPKWLELYE